MLEKLENFVKAINDCPPSGNITCIWRRCPALLSTIILFCCCATIFCLPGLVYANEWYVRLIVTDTDDLLEDKGNILGRDAESVDGYDGAGGHDLFENPPPAGWEANYLSIVFPHPEWVASNTDFTSDYRAVVSDETKGDSWQFEVRAGANTIGEQTVISWEEGDINAIGILPRSQLKDADGTVLVKDTSVILSYTVEVTESAHSYIWEYLGQFPASPRPKTMPWLYLLL